METKIKRILFYFLGIVFFLMPLGGSALNIQSFENNKCIKKVYDWEWNEAIVKFLNGVVIIKPDPVLLNSGWPTKYLIYANRKKFTVDEIITKLLSPTGEWLSLVGRIWDKFVVFKDLDLRYGPYKNVFWLSYSPDGKKLLWAALDWSKIKIFEDGKVIKSYDYSDGLEISKIIYDPKNTPFWVLKRKIWNKTQFKLVSIDWESDVAQWIGSLIFDSSWKSFAFVKVIKEDDNYKSLLIKDKTKVVADVDGLIYYAKYFPDDSEIIYIAGDAKKMRVWTTQGWVSPKYDEILNLFYEVPNGGISIATYNGVYERIPPVVFSDKGGHFAFVARKEKQWVVVLDGKEVGEYSKAKVFALEGSDDIFAIWAKEVQKFNGWYFTYLAKNIEFFKNYGEIIGYVDYILPNMGNYYIGYAFQPYKKHFAMVWVDGKILSDNGSLDLSKDDSYFLLWDGKIHRCKSIPQVFMEDENNQNRIIDKFIAACDITSNKTFVVSSEYWSQELKWKFTAFKFGKQPKQQAVVTCDKDEFYLFKNWDNNVLKVKWKNKRCKISPIFPEFSMDGRLGYLYEEDGALRFWEDWDRIINLNELNSTKDSLIVYNWGYINNSKHFLAKLSKLWRYWRREGVAVDGKVNMWFDQVYLKKSPLDDTFAYIGLVKDQTDRFLTNKEKSLLIRGDNAILDFSKGNFKLMEPRTWYWDINGKDIVLEGYEMTEDNKISKKAIYVWKGQCDPKTGKTLDLLTTQSFEDELLANKLWLTREMLKARRWLLKYTKWKTWIKQVDGKIVTIDDLDRLKKLYNHIETIRKQDKYKNYKVLQELLTYIHSKIWLQIINNL